MPKKVPDSIRVTNIPAAKIHGGSYRLFENVRNRSAELSSSFVDFTDENKVHAEQSPQK